MFKSRTRERQSLQDPRTNIADTVYYNANFVNTDPNNTKLVEFTQSRSENILDKADDYYMAVVKLEIPHDSIAIFDFDENEFYVTITEAGTDKTVQLIYTDRGLPYSGFRGIYTFQQMLDSINTGLATAHAAAPASPGNAPQMIYDNDSGKFAMIVDTLSTGEIWFNYPLYKLFISLDVIFQGFNRPDRKDYQIIYKLNFDNEFLYQPPLLGSYYRMTQETKSQYNWSNIQSVIVTSRTIPCDKEYISFGRGDGNLEIQAISDYIPIRAAQDDYDRATWSYRSLAGYRLYNLLSSNSLRLISFEVSLVTNGGQLIPLTVAPGETVSCKFMFVKKSMENNEYAGLEFNENFGNVLGLNVKRH